MFTESSLREKNPMRKNLNSYLIYICVVVSLGGFLFGYNTSVISGALVFLAEEFSLTTFQKEIVVAIILIGALFGAIFGGSFADYLGRKKTLFFTTFLFIVGTFIIVIAKSFALLIIGRTVVGLAIGVVSVVVPLFLAEVSPPQNRGALVSLNQLAITIGILIAFIVDYNFAFEKAWRLMFAASFFPAILQLLGLFFVPETPSWLSANGQKVKSKEILQKIHRVRKDEEAIVYAEKKFTKQQFQWKRLFDSSIRQAFFVGIGISVFQQITGINTVIYYAPTIFRISGYSDASSILPTIWIGGVNVFMTIVALWLIDKWGRKILLSWGLIGMFLCLSVLGWSFYSGMEHTGPVSVISLILYVAFFAVSLGPIAWLIISEIYPLKIRGKAMGVATLANWTCNFIVSVTFLTLIDEVGIDYTFWIYALVCIIAFWFVVKKVPETKGKSLEQIQSFWKKKITL